jgi:hypothetical protein
VKRSFIIAALALTCAAAIPAKAQTDTADMLPPQEVAAIVASMGLRAIDRPVWRDGRYSVNAVDRYGREMQVVIDAQEGEVLSVRPRDPRYGSTQPPRGYPEPSDPRYAPGRPPVEEPEAMPPDNDEEEFFDDERQDGDLDMPDAPDAPSQTLQQPYEKPTGAVARRSPEIERPNDAPRNATPLPRVRPALADAQPVEPKKDVRVIDMSKPKTAEPAESKPGEAIRY